MMLPVKACLCCGELFQPRRAGAKYCSHRCLWDMNGKRQSAKRKPEVWWVNSRGYVEGRVWVNDVQVRIKQHRWVVEQYLGRQLEANEDVHHLNGDKTDNRPENLEVVRHGEHTRLTNLSREYKRGYTLDLDETERLERSERAKEIGLWQMGHQAQGMIPRQSCGG